MFTEADDVLRWHEVDRVDRGRIVVYWDAVQAAPVLDILCLFSQEPMSLMGMFSKSPTLVD